MFWHHQIQAVAGSRRREPPETGLRAARNGVADVRNPPEMRVNQMLPRDATGTPPLVGAACALRACGDACLEPGCECECHLVGFHYTPEEHDQPECDADVDADPETVMYGTLNPYKVTCPDCLRIMER